MDEKEIRLRCAEMATKLIAANCMEMAKHTPMALWAKLAGAIEEYIRDPEAALKAVDNVVKK